MNLSLRTLHNNLSEEQEERLLQWLESHELKLNLRTRRNLTNVVPIAQLFHKIHSRLVDPTIFASKNGIQQKQANWAIFNIKVLRRMGITLSPAMIQDLALGLDGAIEPLLYELMISVDSPPKLRSHSCVRSPRSPTPSCLKQKQEQEPEPEAELDPQAEPEPTDIKAASKELKETPRVLTLDVEELVDGQMKKSPRKLVLYEQYMKLQRECEEKDSLVSSITQKATYYEGIIKVKEERISELIDQLSRLSVDILASRFTLDS